MDNSTAYLYNDGEYSIFSFGNVKLKFLTSKNLEKYINVKEWDNGYLVVTKKNIGKSEQEDYIDLQPILENLYMDPEKFYRPIKKWRLDMSEEKITEITENANMIIDGYAFTRKEDGISILNLKNPDHAMFISEEGTMLETNMDEIEQVIVQNIWAKDREYMETENA